MKQYLIKSYQLFPLDIPLTDDFVISQGKVSVAKNIILRIDLENGISGFGEITPFPELAGADRESCLENAKLTGDLISGKDIAPYKYLCSLINEITQNHSSVKCGFQTAIIDALSRSLGISMSRFFGGKHEGPFETDITIPILSFERSFELASQWHSRGFRRLKMKVGIDQDKEMKLIRSIHDRFPDINFIVDANQGFTPEDAVKFARELSSHNIPVIMFEQPVHKKDIEGLAQVKNSISIPVAADEAVFSLEDLRKVIYMKAADIINLKIMKTGILDTIDIAVTTYTMGLRLMIGGMVETRLAMGASASIVGGLGIIDYLDLDTPLLLAEDPLEGGYYYKGPKLYLSNGPGLDMKLRS
jgi:L-Ala-D/L-Glu epimerase